MDDSHDSHDSYAAGPESRVLTLLQRANDRRRRVLDDAATFDALLDALDARNEPEARTRIHAIEVLSHAANPADASRVRARFAEALALEGSPDVRRSLLAGLERWNLQAVEDTRTLHAIVACLRSDPDPTVRQSSARCLNRLPFIERFPLFVAPHLADALADESGAVRRVSAETARRFADHPGVEKALRNRLSDDDPLVRQSAARSLGATAFFTRVLLLELNVEPNAAATSLNSPRYRDTWQTRPSPLPADSDRWEVVARGENGNSRTGPFAWTLYRVSPDRERSDRQRGTARLAAYLRLECHDTALAGRPVLVRLRHEDTGVGYLGYCIPRKVAGSRSLVGFVCCDGGSRPPVHLFPTAPDDPLVAADGEPVEPDACSDEDLPLLAISEKNLLTFDPPGAKLLRDRYDEIAAAYGVDYGPDDGPELRPNPAGW